jgi:tetratricopeptide (TPR) repeat protein
MNPKSDVAPIPRDGADQPVVSALDLGRELFGNVVDVALYGMPDVPSGSRLPDVSLVLRVNDEERSRALWDLGLGMLCQATGAAEPTTEAVGGAEMTSFVIEGLPLYLTAQRERLILASSRAGIERALGQGGKTVKHDAVLGKSLAVLEKSPTFLLAACPGRIARMALPYAPAEEAAKLEPFAAVMAETAVTLSAQHSNTRFALHARVEQIPDVSGLVGRALESQRGLLVVGRSDDRLAQVSGPAAAAEVSRDLERSGAKRPSGDLVALRERFDELAARGDRAAAVGLVQRMLASSDDAAGLCDFARALLEEERYAKAYDGVARTLALRANELSGRSEWRQLDTLALAEFRSGNFDAALRLAEEAVELAVAHGELGPELEETLERYRVSAGQSLAGAR